LIHGTHHTLQTDLDASLADELDPPQATLEGRHLGEASIRPRRDAIERDLDEARRILGEQVGRPLADHRAVRVEREEQPSPLEPAIDVEEVGADEDLATGQEQPEPARIHDLAGDAVDLVGAELALTGPPVAGREI